MHIFNNIRNFLYDNNNFVAILDNRIYLYNIKSIKEITNSKMMFVFNNKVINIIGDNLKVVRSENKELELSGTIKEVIFNEIIK